MDIVTYLKQLTVTERKALAAEVGTTDSYMRRLSSNSARPSIGLFAAIRMSNFNRKLSPKLRLKKDDENTFRLEKARG